MTLQVNDKLVESLHGVAAASGASPAPVVEDSSPAERNLDLLMDVELGATLRFGRKVMTLRNILELASGSVIELDRQLHEPVDLLLEGKLVARGEVVIVDGNYGLRVTEVAAASQKRQMWQ
jgi:flagellar motor switch protein FliN/FliY